MNRSKYTRIQANHAYFRATRHTIPYHTLPHHRHAHTQQTIPSTYPYPKPKTQHPRPNTHTHYVTLHSNTLESIMSHYTPLHCTTPYITFPYIALHNITVSSRILGHCGDISGGSLSWSAVPNTTF